MKKLIFAILLIGIMLLAPIGHVHAADPKDTRMKVHYETFKSLTRYTTLDYKIFLKIGPNEEILWKSGHLDEDKTLNIDEKIGYATSQIRFYCFARTCFWYGHVTHWEWNDKMIIKNPNGQTWYYYVSQENAWMNGWNDYGWGGWKDEGWCKYYVTGHRDKCID